MKPAPTLLFLLFALLYTVFNAKVSAQEFSYSHYNTRDGLAGATVYSIAQDKDGFIWFGTETGLSRFDGKNFKNFTVADGLPNNEIIGIFTDSKNRTWISSFKNAACYYYKGKFYNPKNNSTLRKIRLNSPLLYIHENIEGDILVGNEYEAYLLKENGIVIELTRGTLISKLRHIQNFNPIAGIGSLPIGMTTVPDNRYRQLNLPIGQTFLSISFAFNGSLTYYACQRHPREDTLLFFRAGDSDCHRIPLAKQTRFFLPINRNTFALIREYNGVTLYNTEDQNLTSEYLTRHTVQYVFEDIEKNLWFATKGLGVFKLSNELYKNYVFQDLGVRNILEIKNKIFIGTDNSGFWTMPALTARSFNRDKPSRIKGNLRTITTDTDKAYINYASSDFLHLDKGHPQGHFTGNLKTIQLYQDTMLLVSSRYCLTALISNRRRPLDTIYDGRATCAYHKNGVYYIGTFNGLYRFGPGKSKYFLGDLTSLLDCEISQIAEGNDGTLWIATYGNGVIGFKNNRVIANIRERNGLTSDIARCLFVSGTTLWAGTDKGLNKINIDGVNPVVVRKFAETDGLSSNIVNTVYTNGRYVYIGTALGMTVFDESIMPRHAMCNLRMTKIIVSGLEKNLCNDHLLLPHKDNNIRFEYSGISFLSGGEITFQYRLLGLDDKWQFSKESMLSYPSLPSGHYTLMIQAINKFGDKSTVLKYPFEISETIWEKWWIRLLLLFIVIISTVFIAWLLIRRSDKKEKEKLFTQQRLMELEQMALQGLLNPHFIFNSIAAIKQYYNNGDLKKANGLVDTFSSLIRQTFETGTEIFIPLDKELNYITRYLSIEQVRFNDSFQFYINKNLNVGESSIPIPTMLLQPLIENAVRHGIRHLTDRNGEIKLDITQKDEEIEVIISDNGIGRERSRNLGRKRQQTGSLTSTIVNARRIDILNKLFENRITQRIEDITNDRQEVIGTRVILSYPLSIQDLKADKLF